MILQNSPKKVWFKRIKCCAFGCYLTLKKSTWLWWETNSNQQSSREKETVVKRKTRSKRGFPSHKSSPNKERKQKRERKQESVTHSVDFFYYYYFCIFLRTRNSIATPPCAVIETERASKAATLKETHKKRETTKKQAKFVARNTIYVLRAECGSFFSFARACHKSNTSKQKNEEMRIYKISN